MYKLVTRGILWTICLLCENRKNALEYFKMCSQLLNRPQKHRHSCGERRPHSWRWTCGMITIMVVELKIRKRMRKNWKKSWTYWVITTIVMEVKVREGMKWKSLEKNKPWSRSPGVSILLSWRSRPWFWVAFGLRRVRNEISDFLFGVIHLLCITVLAISPAWRSLALGLGAGPRPG